MNNLENIKTKKFDINIFEEKSNKENNNDNKINIKLVIKNENIYIESESNNVEIVDSNSAIEIVDEHYKKINKEDIKEDKYNIEKIIDKKYKVKYKSIYGLFKSLVIGFRRISNYSILKKLLLLGFFASSMFIVYSVCNLKGIQKINDNDFITTDKNYLNVENEKLYIDNFKKVEEVEGIDFVLPGDRPS